ncbi:MAG TPA: DUF4406 domain-containing protein [Terriglobia bacterium]|nr:DUF4406 domain-containing protein [Terriglobia bacterium]
MAEKHEERIGLSFIDILFAVVVGIGFERATSKPWFRDLLHNWWDLELWMFLLGNTIVIASWIGYHRMMTKERLDPEIVSVKGFLRFFVDVTLLFFYCRILVVIDAPPDAFRTIVWIFTLYLVWDLIVITEKRVEKRSGVSLLWFLVFLIIYSIASKFGKTPGGIVWHALCFLATCSAVGYRIHAHIPVPLLDRIARPATQLFEVVFGKCRRARQLRIYVAGPYTADTEDERVKNVKKAIDGAITLYRKGHSPYIPHLTHWVDKRAKELGIAITREDYVRRWDIPWIEVCDALLLLADSPGAKKELIAAEKLRKQIFGTADEVPPVSSRV